MHGLDQIGAAGQFARPFGRRDASAVFFVTYWLITDHAVYSGFKNLLQAFGQLMTPYAVNRDLLLFGSVFCRPSKSTVFFMAVDPARAGTQFTPASVLDLCYRVAALIRDGADDAAVCVRLLTDV